MKILHGRIFSSLGVSDKNFLTAKYFKIKLSVLLLTDLMHNPICIMICIENGRYSSYVLQWNTTQKQQIKRPTVNHGIPPRNSRCAFCLNEKDFAAIIMYSKQQFVYASVYRWIVNALTPTKSSLGVAQSVSMARSHPQSDQLLTTVANNLMKVVNCIVYSLAWRYSLLSG